VLDYIRQLRAKIGTMKILVPGVRTLVLDAEGRLLLERQKLFGSWALPHGCVDVGESALAAAIRETEEEVGVRILRADLFGIYTDPKYEVIYPNGDEVQTFTIAFVARDWEGTPRPDGDEVTEVAFFALDALPDPLYPIHRETIDDFRASQLGSAASPPEPIRVPVVK
jgi:ADP-ribose pyrophosphatase YjhB (NUDIX family)